MDTLVAVARNRPILAQLRRVGMVIVAWCFLRPSTVHHLSLPGAPANGAATAAPSADGVRSFLGSFSASRKGPRASRGPRAAWFHEPSSASWAAAASTGAAASASALAARAFVSSSAASLTSCFSLLPSSSSAEATSSAIDSGSGPLALMISNCLRSCSTSPLRATSSGASCRSTGPACLSGSAWLGSMPLALSTSSRGLAAPKGFDLALPGSAPPAAGAGAPGAEATCSTGFVRGASFRRGLSPVGAGAASPGGGPFLSQRSPSSAVARSPKPKLRPPRAPPGSAGVN
mmetsp:Transcript_23555/g.69981  ORF Transcript_23555/g.69981 Transcript_23555/m.69981 type:complete len:289 (-) Transcript_23555:786-1652(-)